MEQLLPIFEEKDLKTVVSEVNERLRIIQRLLEKWQWGDDVNYAQFAADGELTLHGTARVNRHVRVTAPSWKAGVTAPTEDYIGVFPVWKFAAATDDDVHYSIIVPYRLAAGAVIDANVEWTYTGAQDNGTVCWKLEYITVANGESLDGTTTTITTTTPGYHTTGKLVNTFLTTGITRAVEHDILGLRLWRDTSEDTLATSADLLQVHLRFMIDKLGQAT